MMCLFNETFTFRFLMIFLCLFLNGCFSQFNDLKISGFDPNKSIRGGSADKARATVLDIDVVNNQLVLTGSHLDDIKSIRLTGPADFNESFEIESKSSSTLIANGLRNMSLIANGLFNLIIRAC